MKIIFILIKIMFSLIKSSDETTILMSLTLITSQNNNELTNTDLPLYLNDIIFLFASLYFINDYATVATFLIKIKNIDITESP